MRVHYEQGYKHDTSGISAAEGGWVAVSDDFELVAQGKTKNEAALNLVGLIEAQFACERDVITKHGVVGGWLKLNVPLDQDGG